MEPLHNLAKCFGVCFFDIRLRIVESQAERRNLATLSFMQSMSGGTRLPAWL